MAIQPLSTRLIKPNFCFTLPPTQHHSSVETRHLFTITDALVRFRKCKACTKGFRWFPWPLKTNLGKKLLKLALKFDENKKKRKAAYSVARGGMTAELNDFLWSESHFSVQLGVQVIQSYLLFYKVSQQLQRQTKRSDMTYWEKQFTRSVSQIFNRPT